jgi:hypothetical protein
VPGYNQVRQTLSEIGEVGSPWRDSLKGAQVERATITAFISFVCVAGRSSRSKANEDSEAVANMLKRQVAAGIEEAMARL